VPSDRTTVTELGTGLGMLGHADMDDAVGARSPVMHSLSPEIWQRLAQLRAGGAYDAEFHAAWENGRAFLGASDGLRSRLPAVVEWKGTGRAPGDEVAPVDLRVDHVYLVSCKYLSKILFNVSPAAMFDHLLLAGQSRGSRAARVLLPGGGDWYAEVAPSEYQALYGAVRAAAVRAAVPAAAARGDGAEMAVRTAATRTGTRREAARAGGAPALPGLGAPEAPEASARGGAGTEMGDRGSDPVAAARTGAWSNGLGGAGTAGLRDLPHRAVELTTAQRDALGRWLRAGWPPGVKESYVDLSSAVARASVRRWEAAMDVGGGTGEAMLWRLLRIGSAPYFVLGSSAERSLRLRIATSWDWRQQFQLISIHMEPQRGGQPRVGWLALVRDRSTYEVSEVAGHIEVRWSHGRFGGLPEAKGYLDTPHHLVPGYFALR
jgi:hypothetical protein